MFKIKNSHIKITWIFFLFKGLPGKDGETGAQGPNGPAVSSSIIWYNKKIRKTMINYNLQSK